jgi:hypothetical protein
MGWRPGEGVREDLLVIEVPELQLVQPFDGHGMVLSEGVPRQRSKNVLDIPAQPAQSAASSPLVDA